MGNHDDGLVSEHPSDAVIEDVLPDMSIHGGEHVVQQVHIGLCVHGARKAHSLLLPARQIDPLFLRSCGQKKPRKCTHTFGNTLATIFFAFVHDEKSSSLETIYQRRGKRKDNPTLWGRYQNATQHKTSEGKIEERGTKKTKFILPR